MTAPRDYSARMTKRERSILGLAVIAVVVAALPWMLPAMWHAAIAPPEISAPARGRILAERFGCFSCHGPGGTGGVPDPGSPDPVPAFTRGVPWEYAESVEELRNWILWGDPDGKVTARVESAADILLAAAVPIFAHGGTRHSPTPAASPAGGHPHDHGGRGTETPVPDEHEGLMKMPAFRSHVTDAQADDLVAYIVALSPKDAPPDEDVRRGFDIAARNGCFACHGPRGSGGIANAGSFKGYIPGFFGEDLRELANDRAEVEAWIRDGNVARLARNPAAKVFLDRQPIKMPAYAGHLTDTEISDLVAMVEWIHEEGGKPE